MRDLLDQLRGGDRRSVRGVSAVVAQVISDPALFRALFNGIDADDPLIRMRAADAVEKITARVPGLLTPFRARVLRLAALATQQEVRWHVAQLIPRLDLTAAQRRRAARILDEYLSDRSRIVKTFAMQALADLAARDPALRAPIVRRLRTLTRTGSPAMKSRGQKLLVRLRAVAMDKR